MTRRPALAAATALVAIVSFAAGVGLPDAVRAHDDHGHFSAGEPGDPKKPARVVKVKMFEDGKKMLFEPSLIEVRRGEQVRFVLENSGDEDHEFVLATIAENKKHGEMMKKFPDMEHDDPNAKRVMTYGSGELIWKFTKRGEFEFACLIAGHYEAGMHGKIIVK
jgi:uncharacterized cupredoxin-like copper-binding protein